MCIAHTNVKLKVLFFRMIMPVKAEVGNSTVQDLVEKKKVKNKVPWKRTKIGVRKTIRPENLASIWLFPLSQYLALGRSSS